MATLTIHNLEEPLRRRLSMRAAARNLSIEEEARQILRAALQASATPESNLAMRIRSRFTPLGDVQLSIESRQLMRATPPLGSQRSVRKARRSAKSDL